MKDGDDLPVTFVSWADAVAFSKKLSAKEGHPYALPTEAEWEYACRAGTATIFGFGDDSTQMDAFDWYDKNTAQAGQGYAHPLVQNVPMASGYSTCMETYGSGVRISTIKALPTHHGTARRWTPPSAVDRGIVFCAADRGLFLLNTLDPQIAQENQPLFGPQISDFDSRAPR